MDSMLSLDDVTFFDEDFRRVEEDYPQQYFPVYDHDTNREVNRRRPSNYFDDDESSESEDAESSSEADESDRINGIPRNETGPRSVSHSEIHLEVTEALKTKSNLLVECPEALKRRYKILTGVLDFWQWKKGSGSSTDRERAEAPNPTIIYFATHTFAESKEVVKELQEHFTHSGHLKNVKMTVLDYRKNLCINENVNGHESSQVDFQCIQMSQNFNHNLYHSSRGNQFEQRETCEAFASRRPRESLFRFIEHNEGSHYVQDIEDLISNGQLNHQCPYFDAKQIYDEAHLVICPQEFIISPLLRAEYNLSLDSAILIFDDGYDIERVCYKEGSITVSTWDMQKFSAIFPSLAQAQGLIRIDPNLQAFMFRVSNEMAELSRWIEEQVDDSPLHSDIVEELRTHEFESEYMEALINTLNDVQTHPLATIPHRELIAKLRKFLFVLTMALTNTQNYSLKTQKVPQPNRPGNVMPVLQITLANAGLLFAPVEDPAISVIVGASVLAPFKTFHSEFGVTFHNTVKIGENEEDLYNKHLFAYCQKGPNDISFGLNYAARNDPKIMKEVIESLSKLCMKVPNGVIALLHTDTFFKKFLSFWRNPANAVIVNQIQSRKHIITELEMNSEERTDALIASYRELCVQNPTSKSSQNGALLLALRRGKVHDRLKSFRGKEKRAIVHVSIPYAAWYLDQQVLAKRAVFEAKFAVSEPQENHDWYESEAFRKLNQSFNLSIQDKEWSIVVVLDNRMRSRQHEFDNLLPSWVQNRFKRMSFSRLMSSVDELVNAQERNEN